MRSTLAFFVGLSAPVLLHYVVYQIVSENMRASHDWRFGISWVLLSVISIVILLFHNEKIKHPEEGKYVLSQQTPFAFVFPLFAIGFGSHSLIKTDR